MARQQRPPRPPANAHETSASTGSREDTKEGSHIIESLSTLSIHNQRQRELTDREVLREAYKQYRSIASSLSARGLGSMAEDAFQAAVLELWQAMSADPSLRNGRAAAWLKTRATSRAIDGRRSTNSAVHKARRHHEHLKYLGATMTSMDDVEHRRDIEALISRYPLKDQKLLLERGRDGDGERLTSAEQKRREKLKAELRLRLEQEVQQ